MNCRAKQFKSSNKTMKYLNGLVLHHHGETQVELSPHVNTQSNKEMGEVADRWNFSTIANNYGTTPEEPMISFQSLTLQKSLTSSASTSEAEEPPLSPMTFDDDEALASVSIESSQRDILNIPSCCFSDDDAAMTDLPARQVSLEPRKPAPLDVRTVSGSSQNEQLSSSVEVAVWETPLSSFTSTSAVRTAHCGTCARFFPPSVPTERLTISRQKRRRGDSDCSMTIPDSDDYALPPRDRRKRIRLNRNRALAAEEFDSILSQISTAESY